MLTKKIAVILLTAFIAFPAFRIISFNAGIEDETTLVAASVVTETSEAVEEPQEVETTSIFSSEESETETEIPEEDIEIDVEDELEGESADDGLVSLGVYQLTAYCPCYKCSEGYGDMTSSGRHAIEGRTVACNSIPEGTHVVIEGHEYVVEDVGGGLGSSVIDIYFEDHDEAEDFGRKFNVTVYRA